MSSNPLNHIQDPHRQVGYLQERLRSDKTPLGLFLAAGCPLAIRTGADEKSPPLIPDIEGMTKIVRQKIAENSDCAPLLTTVEKHFGEDGRSDTTVEDMLSHIRGLRSVVGKGKARDFSAGDLDKLDVEICKIIHELADKPLPGSDTPYHSLASWADAISREKGVEIFRA